MRYLALICCLVITTLAFAQIPKPDNSISWKKRYKAAQTYEKQGELQAAAEYYKSVLADKPTKTDAAYKAGTIFYQLRDYGNATQILRSIQDQSSTFADVNFIYGLALKQLARYDEAIESFERYQAVASGEMMNTVTNEIAGCRMAMSIEGSEDIELDFLTEAINTDGDEFGPIPFTDDVLYYSSNFEGTGQIYRSIRKGNAWTLPKMPSIFKGMEKEHFGNGAFTPTRSRFYFTQCDLMPDKTYNCNVYVILRNGSTWSNPVLLPASINEENANTTHPFVVVDGDKEILYFASNKSGSVGGMDIWMTSKDANSTDMTFSEPVNLTAINTVKDEISPYFDQKKKEIYFSSNGHVGVGGFDVFKSAGSRSSFTGVEHMGIPLNSPANDINYVRSDNGRYGFVSSNRTYDRKMVTTNYDLIRFTMDEEEVLVAGNILQDGNTAELIDNVTVTLHEVAEGGKLRKLNSKIFNDGRYQFLLIPGKNYQIEVEREGFETAYFDIYKDKLMGEMNKNLLLQPIEASVPTNRIPGSNNTILADRMDTPSNQPEGTNQPPGRKPQSPSNVVPGRPQPTTAQTNPSRPSPSNRTPGTQQSSTRPVTPTRPSANEGTMASTTTPISKPTPPVLEQSSNQFVIIGTKSRENLSSREMADITYVSGKPYLKVSNGFIKIVDTPEASSNTYSADPLPAPVPSRPSVTDMYGSHFKIQLAAVSMVKPYKFTKAETLGEIQYETINDGLTRVLVAPFSDINEAKRALSELKSRGFDRAFIVEYDNGERVGKLIR